MVQQQSLLIVEDNIHQLARYKELAVEIDLDTYTASSIAEAKVILSQNYITFLLVDIHLSDEQSQSGYEGLDLLDYAQESHPSVLPIVMTSDPRIETYRKSLKYGSLGFLKKPVLSSEELKIFLEDAYNRRISKSRNKAGISGDILVDEKTEEICMKLGKIPQVVTVISGESGTGKEEVAKLIHRYREDHEQRKVPFVPVNCPFLGNSSTMVNSILFGHAKGAFTGAVNASAGLVSQANGGILFLDEIHTLPVESQRLLLRLLNDGSYTKLGETKLSYSSFQVIVASTKPLDDLVEQGEFLIDLRGRLTGIDIELAPLRQRKQDIAPLIDLFFDKMGGIIDEEEKESLVKRCESFYWQGNIRQLNKAIQTMISLAMLDATSVKANMLPVTKSMKKPNSESNEEGIDNQGFSEILNCLEALEQTGTKCDIKQVIELLEKKMLRIAIDKSKTYSEAAEMLNMNRSTFDIKRKKFFES